MCITSKLLYSLRSQKDKAWCRENKRDFIADIAIIWCSCSLYKVSIMEVHAFHKACYYLSSTKGDAPNLKLNLGWWPRLSSSRSLLHESILTVDLMKYKSSVTAISIKTIHLDRMAAPTPVAIGTRGTIGSLVKKEIEYFSMFELGNSQRPQPHFVNIVSGRGYSTSRSSFWVLLMTGKRRKRRGNNVFLPKMCSVAEVVESNKWNRVPGYSYRILKDDINNFQLWLNTVSWISLNLYLEWPKTCKMFMLFFTLWCHIGQFYFIFYFGVHVDFKFSVFLMPLVIVLSCLLLLSALM